MPGAVLATIRMRLGPTVRQQVEAEDVLQDTFTRALGAVERFEWQDRLLSPLARVPGHPHRAGRNPAPRHRRELQIDRDIKGAAASPSKHLRRKERLERLRKSLGP